jgi:hypothetical protein
MGWGSGPKVTLPFEGGDNERRGEFGGLRVAVEVKSGAEILRWWDAISLFLRIPRLGTTCFFSMMIGISSLEEPVSDEDLGESGAFGRFVWYARGQKEPLLKGHLRLVAVGDLALVEVPEDGVLFSIDDLSIEDAILGFEEEWEEVEMSMRMPIYTTVSETPLANTGGGHVVQNGEIRKEGLTWLHRASDPPFGPWY